MGAPAPVPSGSAGLTFAYTTISALILGLVLLCVTVLFLLAGVSLINRIGLP